MRVAAHAHVSAPPSLVWDVISDPTRQLSYRSGITRWEVEGDRPTGLGARYRMLLRAGKEPKVVIAAIARELSGFVWAIAKQTPAR